MPGVDPRETFLHGLEEAFRDKSVSAHLLNLLNECVVKTDGIHYAAIYDYNLDPILKAAKNVPKRMLDQYYADLGFLCAGFIESYPKMLTPSPTRQGPASKKLGSPLMVEMVTSGETIEVVYSAPIEPSGAIFAVMACKRTAGVRDKRLRAVFDGLLWQIQNTLNCKPEESDGD